MCPSKHPLSARPATLSRPAGGLPSQPRWYACRTRSRHEKRVEAYLRQHRIDSFLPLLPRRQRWHDRTKITLLPLFPGYLFARSTPEALLPVLAAPGVIDVVRTNGRPVPLPEDGIENVRRVLAALTRAEVVPSPASWRRGQPVRIVSGPFEGIEGVVVSHRRGRVLVGIASLPQAIELDVSGASLEAVSGKTGSPATRPGGEIS
jgi:transcription antitermination factor NusG